MKKVQKHMDTSSESLISVVMLEHFSIPLVYLICIRQTFAVIINAEAFKSPFMWKIVFT